MALKEISRQLEALRQNFASNPYDFDSLAKIGLLQVQLGEKKEALEVFNDLSKINPRDKTIAEYIDWIDRDDLNFRIGNQVIVVFDKNTDAAISERIISGIDGIICRISAHFGIQRQGSFLIEINSRFPFIAKVDNIDRPVHPKVFLHPSLCKDTVLYHEIAHVLLPSNNRFLAEGIAIHCQSKFSESREWPFDIENSALTLSNKNLIPLFKLANETDENLVYFHHENLNSPENRMAYLLAGYFIDYIISKYGVETFGKIYELCKKDGKNLFAKLKSVINLDAEKIEREWLFTLGAKTENSINLEELRKEIELSEKLNSISALEDIKARIENDFLSADYLKTYYYGRCCFKLLLLLMNSNYQDTEKILRIVNDGIIAAKHSLDLNQNFSDSHRVYAELLGAKIKLKKGGYAAVYGIIANQEIEKAIRLDPNNAYAYLARGRAYLYTPQAYGGGTKKALFDFKKSMELMPDFDDAYVWYAIAVENQNTNEFQAYLKRGLEINSNNLLARALQKKFNEKEKS